MKLLVECYVHIQRSQVWDTEILRVFQKKYYFLFVVQQLNTGLGDLVVEVSRSHSDRQTHAAGQL
jgi:hypothetical protein